jgi:ligand-binding sensor domain-containing protein
VAKELFPFRLREIVLALLILGRTSAGTVARGIELPVSEGRHVRFTHLSTAHGLSQSRVDHIVQDNQGFLWFGTYNGLNRYDGYRFKVYKHEANNPNSLSGVFITALLNDRNGMLWIGVDQFLDRFNPVTETFTHYQSDPNEPNSLAGHVEHICQDRDGMLWVATRNGLDRLDPSTGRFTHYRNDPKNPATLGSNDVRFVLEDRAGTLWVATATDVDAFDRRTGKVIRYPHFQDTPLDRIHEDRSGVLWLSSTRAGGLAKLDRQTGKLIHYTFANVDTPASTLRGVPALHEDQDGTLWLGTNGYGLLKFDRDHRRLVQYRNDPGDPDSLNHNDAISLAEDREGGIWVGTAGGGVNRFARRPLPFATYRKEPGNPNSLDRNYTQSVFEDSQGTLWIGTAQLNRLDRKTGRYIFYRHNPADPGSISNGTVHGAVEDRSGILWFGTWGGGLNRFDRRTGRFKPYRHNPADPNSLSHDYVYSLCLNRSGTLWAGTEDGLSRVDLPTAHITVYRNLQGPPSSRIYHVLAEDPQGALWLGTYEWGLQRFDPGTGKFLSYRHDPKTPGNLSNNRVNALCVDRSGTLWVGTQNGLNRLDPKTGIFSAFYERDGLPNNAVQGILEDSGGNLWLSTGNGLSNFDPRTKTFKNYYAGDGLAGDEFNNSGVYYKSPSGEMFFGGMNGITAFYPDKVMDNPYVPPIVLTDFRLFNDRVPIGGRSPLRKAISHTDSLTLSHQQNIFSLEFSALSYVSPARNRYRYKLQGLETEWNETGSDRRFVTYTTLAPGDYVFRTQGSNNRGVWNEKGTVLHIHIAPALWDTWWFRTLTMVAIVLLLCYTYYSHLQSVERQFNLRLEERVAERTRIARELHDTLLQSFQALMLRFQKSRNLLPGRPLEAMQALDGALDRAAQAIAESRDAIQALRSSPVMDNDLAQAVTALGGELAAQYITDHAGQEPVAFRLVVEGMPQDLHPILRDEVYGITREALCNAFLHAQASRIEVEMRYGARQFRLRVRDNGKGINPKLLEERGLAGHWGLPGMRERAKLIGARLDIWSELNAGTEIELSITGSIAYATSPARRRSRLFAKRTQPDS